MATLNALKKAPIRDESGVALSTGHNVTSSDPTKVAVGYGQNYAWFATGLAAGTSTITAVRTLDNATATLEVTVVAGVPFATSLGDEVPA